MASKPKGQHPADIKAKVTKAGTSLTALAKAVGLSESTCRGALRRPIPAGNRAIAELLRLPLNALWPRWYDAMGKRIAPHFHRQG